MACVVAIVPKMFREVVAGAEIGGHDGDLGCQPTGLN